VCVCGREGGRGAGPACRVISHCFAKIAASDDGNFIWPPHEADAREKWKDEREGTMCTRVRKGG